MVDESREAGVEKGYRGPQVCKIVGISYRQLDYWARTGLVRPSLQDARGSGTQRLYSFRDLVHLKVIKGLLDAGVNLPQIRKAIHYLAAELNEPLEKVTLLSDGRSIYAATSEKDIVDLLRKGQGVFGIALGQIHADIEGTLKELMPAAAEGEQPAVRASSRGTRARTGSGGS